MKGGFYVIGIYMIKNKINGKTYVGQSSDIEKRFTSHLKRSSNKMIRADVEEFGIDSLEITVLCLCKKRELSEKEEYYYYLIKPDYNLRKEFKILDINDEVKNKMKLAAKKRMEDPRLKEIGLKNLEKGAKFRKEKVGVISKNLNSGEEKEFESLSEAQRITGVQKSSIHQIINGKRKQSKGFVFRYSK